MAETLLSPGVLARENDQSQVTSQPISVGAAVVGPTTKGPVEIPTVVTSYSQFKAIFGGAVESGSNSYNYMTGISAYNYFQNGGESLLVSRVTSGSFSPAESTRINTNLTDGLLLTSANALLGSINSGFDIATTSSSPLVTTADALLASINPGFNISSSAGNGPTGSITGIGLTGSISGVDAIATFNFSTSESVSGITVTTAGTGFDVGETITIPSASFPGALPGGTDMVITLVADDLSNVSKPANQTGIGLTGSLSGSGAVASVTFNSDTSVANITVTSAGTGYVANETITIPSSSLGATTGGGTDMIITLNSADLLYQDLFDLETLSEGEIMNNAGGTETGGALPSGSIDNIRWEIASVNTSSGLFSLFVRRGDDNNREKVVLETWSNLSLDPKSENYIEKVIGNSTKVILNDNGTYYVEEQGTYANKSRYIRVKDVHYKTPDYFDNNGNVKSQYTSSMPQLGSGSFENATGTHFNPSQAANFYKDVNSTDIQGLTATDYDIALKLLANKDDYRYNVITTPGLTSQNASSTVTTMVNNSVNRGDSIAVVDLVDYQANIGTVTTQAAGFDSSYGAAYWPWVQVIDPETGQQVWVPASTVIPGVYAYTDRSSDAWFAPAGLTRGALGNVIRAERKLPSTSRDTLYEANVNPIATFPQSGVVVFGQKTLQKRATALDRINVRRLLIQLKSYISQIADNLVFEQNTTQTRNSFLSQVNPYLESVQQRQGLYAFKVVMDESNNGPDVVDRNELVGQIFLQPTKTAEFILLDFNVTSTGASFE
jgi:phage tail sheath protein FI